MFSLLYNNEIIILFEDPPVVNPLSQQNITEGSNLSVNCTATPGNPSTTTIYWTKIDNLGFRENGSILKLFNIQRTNSGTYVCAAENKYINERKGTHNETMVVNVQCKYYIRNYYDDFYFVLIFTNKSLDFYNKQCTSNHSYASNCIYFYSGIILPFVCPLVCLHKFVFILHGFIFRKALTFYFLIYNKKNFTDMMNVFTLIDNLKIVINCKFAHVKYLKIIAIKLYSIVTSSYTFMYRSC